jgi:hypothetical protein
MFWNVCIRSHGENSYEAVVPDLPGCRVTSDTKARALVDIHLLIESRIAEILGTGEAMPDAKELEELQQTVADAEWLSIHVNLAHLEAVARHQAGRWS